MPSTEDNTIYTCPHCGAENSPVEQNWMTRMRGGHTFECVNCKQAISRDRLQPGPDSKVKDSRRSRIIFFIVAALLFALVFYLNRTFSVLSIKKDSGQILYAIVIILLISSTLASGKSWQRFKFLILWAGIFIFSMAAYSYRYELSGVKDRILAEFAPANGFQQTTDSVSFPISSDGHFYIRAQVNGTPVLFLVDTGASDIVLSPDDAEKVGIDADQLNFDQFFETANGMVRGSSIRIADFRIGEFHLKQIGVSVNEVGMSNSLLGMTFFKHLKSYSVKGDTLTLYWNRE
jgi:aspartyl protease family protein